MGTHLFTKINCLFEHIYEINNFSLHNFDVNEVNALII